MLDGHGCVKPEAFPPHPAEDAVLGRQRPRADRPGDAAAPAPATDAPLSSSLTLAGQLQRRRREAAAEAARPLSPKGRRYFAGSRAGGLGLVDVSEQMSLADELAAATDLPAPAGEPGLLALEGMQPPDYLPLSAGGRQPAAPSRGAAARRDRRLSLLARCRGNPSDVSAWLEFADFQWEDLGEGAGVSAKPVREKQCSILSAALEAVPDDVRLLEALEAVENDQLPYSDVGHLLEARQLRLQKCTNPDALEGLTWACLEMALHGTKQVESPLGATKLAAMEALRVLGMKKVAAGHDGRAFVAVERAELAVTSAVAFSEAACGRHEHALALLRAAATLSVVFPGDLPAALHEAWACGCQLGYRGVLYMLHRLRTADSACSGSGAQGAMGLPPALAPLGEALELAGEGSTADDTASPAAPFSLLAAEGGRLRRWAAEELWRSALGATGAAGAAVALPAFEELQPFLVAYRTDASRKEALLRYLDAMGAPSLGRHARASRYWRSFEGALGSLRIAPADPSDLSGTLRADQTPGAAIPAPMKFTIGSLACGPRRAALARAILQGLVVWPSDPLLLECMLEALWQLEPRALATGIGAVGAKGASSAAAKLARSVLRISEDPRLYFAYAHGLWVRGGDLGGARKVLLKLCAAAPGDARLAVGWWHLEMRDAMPISSGWMPARAFRILRALALESFDASMADQGEDGPGNGHDGHTADAAAPDLLRAASRLRASLPSRDRADAGGCRLLLSSYHATLLALFALASRSSPPEAWATLLQQLPPDLHAGLSSARAAAEDVRCQALTLSIAAQMLAASIRPGGPVRFSLAAEAIQTALRYNPRCPRLLRLLAAVHLRRGTVALMRRDLDRCLECARRLPLQARPGLLGALCAVLEAELCSPGCSYDRVVRLCEHALGAAGNVPFTRGLLWLIHHTMLLLRSRTREQAPRCSRPAAIAADIELRWLAASRAVESSPASKVLWLLLLSAWEARASGGGLRQPSAEDEEELLALVDRMEARQMRLHADPLEAIA